MPRAGTVPVIPKQEERREQLAINLFDLDHIHPTVRAVALAGKVDVSQTIWIDRTRMDETAVLFTCPLVDAAAVCDVLRAEARRHNDPPIRVYLKKVEAWVRLPHVAVLSLVRNGTTELSPEWFPRPVESIPFKAPARKAVF